MLNVQYEDKKILINGKPKTILAGEIHYFRLDVEQWEDRIVRLKNLGFNAVATYIPWSIHEQEQGIIDLDGKTKPQYNLGYFLELVQKHDLYFIARPGPFTMAETIGDGVPLWLSENYDEINIITWDNNKAPTVTRDYMADAFQKYAKIWLDEVYQLLTPYKSKNLISIQLDNEIGMLSWVSNSPELSDNNINLLQRFIIENNFQDDYSFDVNNIGLCTEYFRSPKEEYVVAYHYHLGLFNRSKYCDYVDFLKNVTHDAGLDSVPLVINIHGTGGGRLFGYPIGLSQLQDTYFDDANMTAGSDLYFDDTTLSNFHEVYLASALTEATLGAGQPLMSMEFNSTSGDYGNSLMQRKLNSSLEIQSYLLLSQNNKLVNYYLFTGGYNDFKNIKTGDGRDRIGNTGEHHGYGAPIGPTGKDAYFIDVIDRIGNFNQVHGDKLASMNQIKDSVSIGFISEYYGTEFKYPNSKNIQEVYDNIARNRDNIINNTLIKYALIKNIQLDVTNLSKENIDTKLLLIGSSKYMPRYIQEKIVDFLKSNGQIIFVGEPPHFDVDGSKCEVLISYMRIQNDDSFAQKDNLTLVPIGICSGSPSHFSHFAKAIKSSKQSHSIIDIYDSNSSCALVIEDEYKAAFISCFYRMDIDFFDKLFQEFKINNRLTSDSDIGLFTMMNSNKNGEGYLTVINFDEAVKSTTISFDGNELFDGKKIEVSKRKNKFLPINIQEEKFKIIYASEQIKSLSDERIVFELVESKFDLKLESDEFIFTCDQDFVNIVSNGNVYEIHKSNRLVDEEEIIINIVRGNDDK